MGMTVATEFHNWSDNPSETAKQRQDGSPALKRIRDFHLARWGGESLSAPSLYNPRKIRGGTKMSAHAGSAVDLRWQDPGPGRSRLVDEILPFYIANSQELHIQAIHDYVGCRVWRANRSSDEHGGWREQERGSHDGKMGDPSAQWIHLEINRTGWDDRRSVEEMLRGAVTPTPTNGSVRDRLRGGDFGDFPTIADKPRLRIGANDDFVCYAQAVIFHRFGGGIAMDGDFGNQTKGRIMDLQRHFGLEVGGGIGPNTWATLDRLAVQGAAVNAA